MAGLSEEEFRQIPKQQMQALAKHFEKYPWEWVITLTVSNIPGTHTPRFSVRRLLIKYQEFRSRLVESLGASLEDLFVPEHGDQKGRLHLNVLVHSKAAISPVTVRTIWREIAMADVWMVPYDSKKGVWYWIKEMEIADEVALYGGSVVESDPLPPVQTKPRRKRKSDYNRERRRVRYAAQVNSLLVQPGAPLRNVLGGPGLPQATIGALEAERARARRILATQGIA